MKIMIVYDSLGGSTEKKIGEPFSLSMLAKADGVAFGSPCIYANVTEGMQSFLENMKAYVKAGKMDVKGKRAAIFGSYGWDGAWVMEEKLKAMAQEIGYRVQTCTSKSARPSEKSSSSP